MPFVRGPTLLALSGDSSITFRSLWTCLWFQPRRVAFWQKDIPVICFYALTIPFQANNSWNPTGVSTLTHPLQHISGKDRDRRLRRSWRHCQHRRQNNHQSPLFWLHGWLSRRGRRTGKVSVSTKVHSLRHGDQCGENQADDKQRLWHQHRD